MNAIDLNADSRGDNIAAKDVTRTIFADALKTRSHHLSRRGTKLSLNIEEIKERRKNVRKVIYFFELTQAQGFSCPFGDNLVMKIFVNKTKWKSEALSVVQMANHLTSLWRLENSQGKLVLQDEEIFFGMVRTNVLFSKAIYGSAICFDYKAYQQYARFCPYGYRDSELNGTLHVKDLNDTDYLDPIRNNVWWLDTKKKALLMNVHDYMTTEIRTSANTTITNTFPFVPFDHEFWTNPYFDCLGGKEWMFSYVAPFFNKSNNFM